MALPAARGAREEAVAACRVAAYRLTGGTTLRRRLLVPSQYRGRKERELSPDDAVVLYL